MILTLAQMLPVTAESSGRIVPGSRVYVSPHGNDTNPGTIEQPLRTLNAARRKVREIKAVETDHNIFFADNQEFIRKRVEHHRKQYDNELNSRCIDPGFVDAASGDFRLTPDSPLHKIGFKVADLSSMVLTSEFPEHLKVRSPYEKEIR